MPQGPPNLLSAPAVEDTWPCRNGRCTRRRRCVQTPAVVRAVGPRPRHPRSCAQWGRATRPGGSVLTFHEQVLGSVMCNHVVSESRASEASWF